jgi:rhodanese-related sulfurtransferase
MFNMFNSKPSLSLKEIFEKTQSKENYFVDVRTPPEYAAVHAFGAESIPLNTIDSSVVEKLKGYKEVYVICQSGGRSATATSLLVSNGVNAINVEGGTNAWRTEGLPVI